MAQCHSLEASADLAQQAARLFNNNSDFKCAHRLAVIVWARGLEGLGLAAEKQSVLGDHGLEDLREDLPVLTARVAHPKLTRVGEGLMRCVEQYS